MNLAIKGHPKRGKEVIETLEMLGGRNPYNYCADCDSLCFTIDKDTNIIYCDWVKECYEDEDTLIFTLEEFLEKFPYKVGDKVLYKIYGIYSKIKSMLWNVEKEQVFYRLDSNKLFVATADELKPRKEETMEEKEPEPKAPILSNRYDYAEGKCGYVIPDGYEFDSIKQGFQTEIILRPIKSQYPKTYEECCEVIGINRHDIEIDLPQTYQQKMFNLFKLHICRDAYWKIAGEQMGLDGSWEPDYITEDNQLVYIITTQCGYLSKNTSRHWNYILAFPTEEMRDKFYENFKELIEQCKELL